jgi:hypothetical protein
LVGCEDHNIGVQYAVPLSETPAKLKVPVQYLDQKFEMHFMVAEFSGDVRYALTLLATLNDIPKVMSETRPSKSFLGGGQIRPGKYDDVCTQVRKEVGGNVIVMVFGGVRGSGFSCQADLETTLALPDILENMAAQIRRDGIAKSVALIHGRSRHAPTARPSRAWSAWPA